MKNRTWRRAIAIGLGIVVLAGSIAGCSNKEVEVVKIEPMTPEESVAISFDIIGGKDVMPLLGFYGPNVEEWSEDGLTYPSTVNDEIYKMIADCGINIISYSLTEARAMSDPVQKMMDLGVKYGIGSFVTDSRIRDAFGEQSLSVEEMATIMAEYMNHPGFAGMYLVDEPGTKRYSLWNGNEVSNYPELYDKLVRQLDTFAYFNLLPITSMDKKDEYIAYVEECLNTVKPNYLSYDKYPFEEANVGREDCYFWNLATMREYAQQAGIPLWTYMQCGDQWNLTTDTEKYWPNEWQFDWQVNTNLAFGVQGLQFYTLMEYPGSAVAESQMFDSYRSGLIGIQGNKTQWYHYAQEINQHIAAIDHVLMNSVNKGVIASGEKATWATSLCSDKTMIQGTAWRELASVEGEALVGCFNYQGKTALYIVNYSTEFAQNIKLSFVDKYNITVFQQAEAKRYNADGITLDMPAGDGVLIVFGE